MGESQKALSGLFLFLERVKGIEPSYAAWEAAVLPLNYTRLQYFPEESTLSRLKAGSQTSSFRVRLLIFKGFYYTQNHGTH